MAAPLSFEYEFTDDIAERATGTFIRKQRNDMLSKFVKALPALLWLTAIWGMVVAFGYLWEIPGGLIGLLHQTLVWLLGVMLGLMYLLQAVALAVVSLSPGRARRRLRAWADSLREPMIRWTFWEEGFRVSTSNSDRESSWDNVRRLLTDTEFWILGIKNGPDLILPVERLTPAMRELIRRQTADLTTP